MDISIAILLIQDPIRTMSTVLEGLCLTDVASALCLDMAICLQIMATATWRSAVVKFEVRRLTTPHRRRFEPVQEVFHSVCVAES